MSQHIISFYDDLYMVTGLPDYLESLKTFLPSYYPGEKCKKGDNGYFVIENIKGGVGDNVRTLVSSFRATDICEILSKL